MSDFQCVKCGGELECFGGLSAHPDNWTCPKCDKAAMSDGTPSRAVSALDKSFKEQTGVVGEVKELTDAIGQLERDLAAAQEARDQVLAIARELARLATCMDAIPRGSIGEQVEKLDALEARIGGA